MAVVSASFSGPTSSLEYFRPSIPVFFFSPACILPVFLPPVLTFGAIRYHPIRGRWINLAVQADYDTAFKSDLNSYRACGLDMWIVNEFRYCFATPQGETEGYENYLHYEECKGWRICPIITMNFKKPRTKKRGGVEAAWKRCDY